MEKNISGYMHYKMVEDGARMTIMPQLSGLGEGCFCLMMLAFLIREGLINGSTARHR